MRVVYVGGDSGGYIIAGFKADALRVQAMDQPFESVQRMAQDGAAGPALHYVSVHPQLDRLRGEVKKAPIGKQSAFHPRAVASIVGDQRWRADGGPAGEAAVHYFDARQYAGERIGNLLAIERRLRGRQVAGELEGKFRFDDAHEKAAGSDSRGAVERRRRQQAAVEWLGHVEEAPRDGVGAGDFVAYRPAELFYEPGLASIRLLRRRGARGSGEFGQAHALQISVK